MADRGAWVIDIDDGGSVCVRPRDDTPYGRGFPPDIAKEAFTSRRAALEGAVRQQEQMKRIAQRELARLRRLAEAVKAGADRCSDEVFHFELATSAPRILALLDALDFMTDVYTLTSDDLTKARAEIERLRETLREVRSVLSSGRGEIDAMCFKALLAAPNWSSPSGVAQ